MKQPPFTRIAAATIIVATLLHSDLHSQAQITWRGFLLALSKANHTLAIVDPATLTVIARMPVGEDPHEVIASADGRTAYVTIYGGGSLHEINVIDLLAKKPLQNI